MRFSFLLAVAFLTSLPAAADDLQGVWTLTSAEMDGKSEVATGTVIIRDRSWIERRRDGDTAVIFTIDPTRQPKQIDQITATDTLRGIYRVEGDTLTVSIPVPVGGRVSSKRPSTFTTKPGDPFAVMVYKRDTAAEIPRAPQWLTNWNAAFARARDEHRLVLVDYYATWCKPCEVMDATVLSLPDVAMRLDDFVLLRVDVDHDNAAKKNSVFAYPSYIIYDPAARERFRITGARTSPQFRLSLDAARKAAPAIFEIGDLFDKNRDIEANMLLGNTYSRLAMNDEARMAYKDAKGLAERNGSKAAAQMAGALSALTYAREGNPKRALKLLERLTADPADRDTEALIWLTIGNANRMANDSAAALNAYQHALSVAAPGTAAHSEASEAIAALKN